MHTPINNSYSEHVAMYIAHHLKGSMVASHDSLYLNRMYTVCVDNGPDITVTSSFNLPDYLPHIESCDGLITVRCMFGDVPKDVDLSTVDAIISMYKLHA
jgi:hypothetical protein